MLELVATLRDVRETGDLWGHLVAWWETVRCQVRPGDLVQAVGGGAVDTETLAELEELRRLLERVPEELQKDAVASFNAVLQCCVRPRESG